MRQRRRLGGALLLVGLGWMGLSQLAAGPVAAPLFDGVVVEEPYRYVQPPSGAAGDPFSASDVASVVEDAVPLLAVATEEVPPQAQIISQADAFAVAGGTSSVAVSIQPLAPSDPRIAGNIYRFTVTDQAGAAVSIVPGALVTVVLRVPLPDPGATVARLDGDRWVALPTEHGGLPDLYSANIGQVGDFAVLGSGAAASASAPVPSATIPTASPAPSRVSGGGTAGADIPTWVIALAAIAAVGAGLLWGLVFRDEDG